MKTHFLSLKISLMSFLIILTTGYHNISSSYPVIDGVNSGYESSEVAVIISQLIEIQQALQQLQQLNNTIGKIKDEGIGNFITDYIDKYKDAYFNFSPGYQFEKFSLYMPGATEEGLTIDADAFTDIETTKETMTQVFYDSGDIKDVSTANQYRKVRNAAHQEAVLHGYAVSQFNHQINKEYVERSEELSNQMDESDTVIDEIGNNTAALVVAIRQLNDIQAVLASVLEIDSSSSISKAPNVRPPSAK